MIQFVQTDIHDPSSWNTLTLVRITTPSHTIEHAIRVTTDEDCVGVFDLDAEALHLGNYQWEALTTAPQQVIDKVVESFSHGLYSVQAV